MADDLKRKEDAAALDPYPPVEDWVEFIVPFITGHYQESPCQCPPGFLEEFCTSCTSIRRKLVERIKSDDCYQSPRCGRCGNRAHRGLCAAKQTIPRNTLLTDGKE